MIRNRLTQDGREGRARVGAELLILVSRQVRH